MANITLMLEIRCPNCGDRDRFDCDVLVNSGHLKPTKIRCSECSASLSVEAILDVSVSVIGTAK